MRLFTLYLKAYPTLIIYKLLASGYADSAISYFQKFKSKLQYKLNIYCI